MSKFKGLKPYFAEAQKRLNDRGQMATLTATLKEARVVRQEESQRLGRAGVKQMIALIELGVFNDPKAQGATTSRRGRLGPRRQPHERGTHDAE